MSIKKQKSVVKLFFTAKAFAADAFRLSFFTKGETSFLLFPFAGAWLL